MTKRKQKHPEKLKSPILASQDNGREFLGILRMSATQASPKRLQFRSYGAQSVHIGIYQETIRGLRMHQSELESQNEELRQAQDKLREFSARFVDLYDDAPVGYCCVSEQGLICEINLTAARLLGKTKEEILHQVFSDYILPEDKDIFYQYCQLVFSGASHGGASVCELRLLNGNGGGEHLVQIQAKLDFLNTLNWPCIKLTMSDVSAFKRIEQQKEQLQAALQQELAESGRKDIENAEMASRLKSEFIANMSHEIRTPLTIIRGYTELFAQGKIATSNRDWIASVLSANQQLELLINDILDISKMEAGKIDINPVTIDLRSLLSEVNALMKFKLAEKDLHFAIHIDDQIPETIFSDPLRLKQILINVLGNAIKFTDRGKVEVRVELQKPTAASAHLAFTISDTGIGMSFEQSQKIFKAFHQRESSYARRYGGAGLGLTLSLNLARLLGGDIIVAKSEPGIGSIFLITINLHQFLSSPSLVWPSQPSSLFQPQTERQISKDIPTLAGLRILLTEDAEDVRILVTHILHAYNAIVTTAINGIDGVCMALSQSFDVILMDIQMPVLDGYEATKQLRLRGFRQPIFAITAHAMAGERERCLASGFTDYISKPININKLVQLLETHRTPRAPSPSSFDHPLAQ